LSRAIDACRGPGDLRVDHRAECLLAGVGGSWRVPADCDAIPDSAWVEPTAIPLYNVYRWPALSGLAVTAPSPRFGFEAMCGSPPIAKDARAYAVAARSVVLQHDPNGIC